MSKSTLTLKIIDADIEEILPRNELTPAHKQLIELLARIAVQEYLSTLRPTPAQQVQDRMMRLPEVVTVTGRSRSSIYTGIKQNTFPKPISLGARSIGWKESQIKAWLEERSLNMG